MRFNKFVVLASAIAMLMVAGQATAQDPESTDLEKRVQELEKKLEKLSGQLEQSELEKLVEEAEAESKAPEEEVRPEEREFLWGALALQKLNPELSFFADFTAGLIIDGTRFYAGEEDRSGMPIREAGIHFQHVLDPYSHFKAALAFIPEEGLELEEVYITWFGLVPSLSITVGRFKHEFGVLNRWHEHDLDQVNHPLAMRMVLGEEGLVGNGFALKWFMPPLIAHANELTLEVTDGENEELFAGSYFSVPTAMLHLKNYYDLSESTYLELGLTGMFGFNNKRGFLANEGDTELSDESWRHTVVAGADLTLYWSPLQQAKYRSLTWRSEFYYARKELPEISPEDVRHSWGFYSYVQYQLATRWFANVRYDLAKPTFPEQDDLVWDIVANITFWQSEFVYLRLEYSHAERLPYLTPSGDWSHRVDNRIIFQVDFAAGPHKHEKY